VSNCLRHKARVADRSQTGIADAVRKVVGHGGNRRQGQPGLADAPGPVKVTRRS
jgi:hypothetical protein